jgi:hypothetical protein
MATCDLGISRGKSWISAWVPGAATIVAGSAMP